MTAKEFVKQYFPNARAERQVKGRIRGLQEVYYLIRPDLHAMWFATGKSESNAWVKAKKRIIEDNEESIHIPIVNPIINPNG